ncbi:elongation factor P maturation arginine rhamnosyltransferase EarP [Actimicrobium sp. CCC2.4]|uniref:elongation factor P maturation arginine rhamnosyltransferase EarP n=1 Tax=Actimicrobium sp. CCC2.4 TaxID=3048606 RepID=UPI002AC9C14D|nr:elongation factor P maturation arginine rhamnosyltransferase EarP [Actimicrobium sp. CCC2.4]MEB0136364.1 elongation factor P maturation arginine rhamnosyltransferase EarP [Actimicrobium sp. CCC2.4]WPX31183.1 elongation factor P maturation arginine rhamnosyltransferase EarP [Actimicrobium sp. CCC2.4]
MNLPPSPARSLALFCKVVDNFGDIGICWRLARQLQHEHGIAVTLWVDDLVSFRRLCPPVQIDVDVQQVAGVTVCFWRDQEGTFVPDDVPDIVIEFFGCELPPAYVAAMAQCTPRPVWLNLEGLSAEAWVEGCHTLPSPHPRLPLTKHFFFPGFTAQTGGLLHEGGLLEQRLQFQHDPTASAIFLAALGVTPAEMAALKVSLFCYPHAPVTALFEVWQRAGCALTCLVPDGVATDAVSTFLGEPAVPGAVRTVGALTVRVLPFVAQPDYDKLLWACDFNLVRGEDSFVRAQWAGRAFLWHIYPQDENLHHVKLRAFLQRYAAGTDSLTAAALCWNGVQTSPAQDWSVLWLRLLADLPAIAREATGWQRQMRLHGDLAANVLNFATALRSSSAENKVQSAAAR